MQNDLDKLKMWLTKNRMLLSVKTKIVNFSLRNKVSFGDIFFKCKDCCIIGNRTCVNCIKIEMVDHIKYLGVILDEKCNWKEHVAALKNYLNQALRNFYFLQYICPIQVLRTIYFSIIHSKLHCGICCWGGRLKLLPLR